MLGTCRTSSLLVMLWYRTAQLSIPIGRTQTVHTRSTEKCQNGTFQCILEIQWQSANLALWRASGEWSFCPLTTLDAYLESSQIGDIPSLLCGYATAFSTIAVVFLQKHRRSFFYNRMRQRFSCKMTAKVFHSPSKASKNASMASSVSWVGFCSACGWK